MLSRKKCRMFLVAATTPEVLVLGLCSPFPGLSVAFLQDTSLHDESDFGFVVMMLRVPNWAVVL